ncbi:MAG: c-type cytochrome domain-containing protein, partial [Fuerstiella sp.]
MLPRSLVCTVLSTAVVALTTTPAAADSKLEFFETSIRPVLIERCSQCHGAHKQNGGLRVDSLAALLKGGDTGPAIVAGNAADSLLIKA